MPWCCSDCNPPTAGWSGRGTGDLTGPEQVNNRRLSGRNRQRTGGRNEGARSARPGCMTSPCPAHRRRPHVNGRVMATRFVQKSVPIRLTQPTIYSDRRAGAVSAARGLETRADCDRSRRPERLLCANTGHSAMACERAGSRPVRGHHHRRILEFAPSARAATIGGWPQSGVFATISSREKRHQCRFTMTNVPAS